MRRVIAFLLWFCFVAALGPAQAQVRPAGTEPKGVELYSWQEPDGGWLFALLPGTNRLKGEDEIKAEENRISGVEALVKRFGRLAEGEQVFWDHKDHEGFAYPGEAMIEELAAFAREARVELRLPAGIGAAVAEPAPAAAWQAPEPPNPESAPPEPGLALRGQMDS